MRTRNVRVERISWHPFPKDVPKEMRGHFTKVMIDRGSGAEFAMLDDNKPNKREVYLDCNGVLGSTLVEDLNDIKFIARRPIGPIGKEKEEKKKRENQIKDSEKSP